MKKSIYILCLSMIILTGILLIPAKATAQSINYKAYGVFIFTFARFTEWPAQVENSPVLKFAVLGNSAIYDELAETLPGKTINGKKCMVEKIDSPANLKDYHLVFLPALKSGQLNEVIKQTANLPILIVTEHDGLVKKGAAISFVITDGQKLGFELNETALKERQLRMASQLKGLALAY